MKYSEEFIQVLNLGCYVGTGNPNSEILIVGKEVATDIENGDNKELEEKNIIAFNTNVESWKKNIKKNKSQEEIPKWEFGNIKNNPLYAFKGVKINKEGHTWRKYQKLYNLIFGNQGENVINFQENFFITEMSVLPSKTTKEAQKKKTFNFKLTKRKESFFRTEYIQKFPIIILACGNYINGKELTDIFNVKFIERKGTERQYYWIHRNCSENPKLVIHTRQLSANVSNDLLNGIAKEINDFRQRNPAHNNKYSAYRN